MATATITTTEIACPKCKATGCFPGNIHHVCDKCHGTGTYDPSFSVDWLRARVAELEETNRLLQLIVDTEPTR